MAKYVDLDAVLALVEPDARPQLARRITELPTLDVQKHGRLIDADVLNETIQEYIEEYSWLDVNGLHCEKWCAMKEAEMAIEDAPTIIPASDK